MANTTTKTSVSSFKTRFFSAATLTLGLLAYTTLSSWPIQAVETDTGQAFFLNASRLVQGFLHEHP